MKEIFERRSIRKYTDRPIPKEAVDKLLKAAMAAPSAGNQQPWDFIVIDDKNIFEGIMKFHAYSNMLKEAQIAIVVCGNLDREEIEGFWPQDCAAATENLLLEAQHLGIGAVWLGIYPMEERVSAMKELLGLPEGVIAMAVISLGYPAEHKGPSNRYDPSRVHFNKW